MKFKSISFIRLHYGKFKFPLFLLLTVLFVMLFFKKYQSLPKLGHDAVSKLEQQHPVIFLFRHGERCDHSENPCLSDKTGITVSGANEAKRYGDIFNSEHKYYDLYSSDTVSTIQTATYFSWGRPVLVVDVSKCDKMIYQTITDLIAQSRNKKLVIFTHNHCLSFIANNMKRVQFKPNYLGALVMHEEDGNLYLDGQFGV